MTDLAIARTPPRHSSTLVRIMSRKPWAFAAGIVLATIAASAILAPILAPHDPLTLAPSLRLRPPSETYPLGTDAYGRDLLSRVLYGSRISLAVGIGAATLSTALGLLLGLLAGFFRPLDATLMRMADGLMAIPAILLAVAVVSLSGASLASVLIAITLPEIPRVMRLVRSVVLLAREQPYVEAAVSLGTRTPRLLRKHILPNTIAPVIVQASFICASAILTESALSFLGAGISPTTPTWGNIMADGRTFFQLRPSLIFWPGLFLAVTVLSINIIGDAARDLLDPRMKQRETGL